ncbi:hypothetical protein GGI12_001051 [Dipsacomyces acuminosporus]|nr:hypothetical protein GGI12_001051 [Dipsacomyces acuminosporus]
MSRRFAAESQDQNRVFSAFSQDPYSSAGGAGGQLVARLHTIRDDIHGVCSIVDQAIDGCTVVALDLEEVGEGEKVDEMDRHIRSLLESKKRLEIEMDLLSKMSNTTDFHDIEKKYKSSWNSADQKYNKMSDAKKFGTNEKYRVFREQLWEIRHGEEPMPPLFEGQGGDGGSSEEEDLVIAGARMTYKCPITATWLIDPVTSKVCHHSFSKEAIMDYLRAQHGRCVCPVGGCSQLIRMQDIVPDKILERKLARHLRQLEQEEQAASYTVIR